MTWTRVGAHRRGPWLRWRLLAALVGVVVLLAWPAGVAAAPTITEFSAGLTANSDPVGIAAGPDGNLWFTEVADPGRIGRITPSGVISEFSAGLTAKSAPYGIAAGPDGNVWFTEQANRIGRITPSGVISEFSAGLPFNSAPDGITAGPDGNLWFTEGYRPGIGRITPKGVISTFSGVLVLGFPYGIAAGPDGNLWFTEKGSPGRIGRITPSGVISEFSAGLTFNSGPYGITAGPDGNLWFTERTDPGRIGRITAGPGVATGAASDVTSSAATLNGSVRPNSQLTTFRFQYGASASYGSQTAAQLAGPDAAPLPVSAMLSGLSPGTTYHYRLVATNASDTTRGADRTFTTAAGDGTPLPSVSTKSPLPSARVSFAGTKSSIRVDRKRRFWFSFRATPGLKGRASFKSLKKVRVSRRQKKVTLASKSFTVPASGKLTLRIRLSKKNFRILKLNRRIRTRVTVTLKKAAGLTGTASKKITLKAPKPRR